MILGILEGRDCGMGLFKVREDHMAVGGIDACVGIVYGKKVFPSCAEGGR
jgi:hypothetical protein